MFYVTARPRLGRTTYRNPAVEGYRPKANVIESNADFKLFLAVPGLNKEDLTIGVDKDVLTISSHKEWTNTDNATWNRREFNVSKFERKFTLPESVDLNNISATVENGVLKVVLTKKAEAVIPTARTIEIA